MSALGYSKLSRKHQITVPKSVCDALKLHTGDLVVFVRRNRFVVLSKGKLQVES